MLSKRYNILVIEDEWITANYITQILETFNQNVISIVSNGQDALEAIEKNQIDFIFMDINIDGADDGITLAHILNEKNNIPIIYLTAFGDSATIEEASDTNIYGFIIKPFMEKDIEVVLNVAIQRMLNENKYIKIQSKVQNNTIDLGEGYTFDLLENRLYHNSLYVILSKNESKLLYLFLLNKDRTLSLEVIREGIWKNKEIGESTIRDTISRVRKKIIPLTIENIPSIGYVLH